MTDHEADRFVAEQARVGSLLNADPRPMAADTLSRWISDHPELAPTRAQAHAVEFLRDPPLPFAVRFGYRLLFDAASATIPTSIRDVIGLEPSTGRAAINRRSVAALRWALGSSPSWHLALVRAGAPVPWGRFRQPLPDTSGGDPYDDRS